MSCCISHHFTRNHELNINSWLVHVGLRACDHSFLLHFGHGDHGLQAPMQAKPTDLGTPNGAAHRFFSLLSSCNICLWYGNGMVLYVLYFFPILFGVFFLILCLTAFAFAFASFPTSLLPCVFAFLLLRFSASSLLRFSASLLLYLSAFLLFPALFFSASPLFFKRL